MDFVPKPKTGCGIEKCVALRVANIIVDTHTHHQNMRIVCLLPSATDICIALGLADFIVGRAHECNYQAVRTHQTSPSLSSNDEQQEKDSETETNVYILTSSGLSDEYVGASKMKRNHHQGIDSINSLYPINPHTFQLAHPGHHSRFMQRLCSLSEGCRSTIDSCRSRGGG